MNNDLISREALKEKLSGENYQTWTHEYGYAIPTEWVMNAIDNAPTVDVWQLRQEATENALKKAEVLYGRPQGEWIKHIDNLFPEESTEECPFCHEEQLIRLGNDDNFCPNCGADMRKGGAE